MIQKAHTAKQPKDELVFYIIIQVIIWTLIISGLLIMDVKTITNTTHNLAMQEAKANFQKDEAFRFWATTHGGFYVFTDERTQPNPYLAHIPERDIQTPSGRNLTLMNPAFALREILEDYQENYGVAGHITSLLPLRPENAPDKWEHNALESFENGDTVAYKYTEFNGEPHLRYMEPIITQQGCLKCHEHQGYVVGDIRGGVSVSVPLKTYLKEEKVTTFTHIFSFASLWILGMIGITINYFISKKNRTQKEHMQSLLQESHNELESKVIERTNALQIEIEEHKTTVEQLNTTNKQLNANKQQLIINENVLKHSEERYKGIIDSSASCVAVYSAVNDGKDFVFTEFNPMAEKTENLTKDEIIGKKVTEVFPSIKEFGLLKVFQDVYKSGNPQNFPISFYKDDNTQGYRENFVYKLSTNEIVAVYQDVTEMMNARLTTKKERDRLISIFESMVDGVYIINKDYDIEYANTALLKDFGSTEGKKCYEYFHDNSEPCSFCKNDEVFDGKTVNWEWTSQKAKKTYDLIDTPVYNADGSISKLEIFRDITHIKKAQNELTKLSSAVNQSPSIIAIANLDGKLEYVNPKFCDLTGFSKNESIGKNPRFLKSGIQNIEMYKNLWQTILAGKKWHGEFHNKKKNGELFWESATIAPIFDKKGKITSYLKVAEDITERKRNEEIQNVIFQISNATTATDTLENLINKIQYILSKIIDTSNFYVALYNAETDMLELPYYADEKDEFKSAPADKTLTKYVIETKTPLLANNDIKNKLIKSGKLKHQGSLSKVWLGVPLKIEGEVIGVFAVQSYKDENAFTTADMKMLEFVSNQIGISIERKKAEENLINALNKATESARLKSAFLATMSHELRTPLNAIIGFSELITHDWPIEEIIGFANTINSSGNHLLSIVNDIFDITLIEAGESKINNAEVELIATLKDINNILKSEQRILKKENIKLDLILPDSKELLLFTDSFKLKQILINLIKNALKFTKEGFIRFGFDLELDNSKQLFIKFFVEDTGIGIVDENKEIIFETFRQIDDSYTRTYGGAGIGLSISKKLAELLGGTIWFKSKDSGGSIFYFTIPYIKVNVIEKPIKNVSKAIASLNNKTILIVEDDADSYEFLNIVLNQLKANIIWAKNGEESVEICKNNSNIDLVLMDINMDVMNGYIATEKIKSFRPKLPIIAQTALAMDGDREKSFEAGCDDYISKPINKSELLEMISKFIG